MEEQKIDRRTQKRKIGDRGEEMAAEYLKRHGYKIIDRNFLCKTGEIDIVAVLASPNVNSNTSLKSNKKIVSFIEVKSRNSTKYGLPCQAVNKVKQSHIKKSSLFYLYTHPFLKHYQVSFDIIEILNLPQGNYLRHLKNAFE